MLYNAKIIFLLPMQIMSEPSTLRASFRKQLCRGEAARQQLQGLLRHLMKHLVVTAVSEESSEKCITEASVSLGQTLPDTSLSGRHRDWSSPHQVFPKAAVLGFLPLHIRVPHISKPLQGTRCNILVKATGFLLAPPPPPPKK